MADGLSGGQGRGGKNLYTREIPSLNQQLHVHVNDGKVVGANLAGCPVSNYEAAMLDLQGQQEGGIAKGKTW